MCGHTRSDKIRNENIWDKVGVASVTNKMRKGRLRWFEHMERRCTDAPLRRYAKLDIRGARKGRGRSKKYWGEVIRHDMMLLHIIKDMPSYRNVWRSRIRVEESYDEEVESLVDMISVIKGEKRKKAQSLEELDLWSRVITVKYEQEGHNALRKSQPLLE
ncbi:hypothetical protein H5410_016276 [Solanum commersonii]|uniref:Uncharacterized protein n=1 Tax=Solanum commersonii TaxID=4109 RepID=A0A9J5ZWV6_SOLCO|nr:hypothetical protein H5410_016276 [Solanum commersonii]